jgi:hypothetical protein
MKIGRRLALAFVLLTGCTRGIEVPGLSPLERRPVEAVAVADGNEAALLVQELSMEPVRVDGPRIYYIAEPRLNQRLRELGYTPVAADMSQVERRTMRVLRRGDERDLLAAGVRLLNREEGYWIVNGTLVQLAALRDRGYRLTALGPGEPRPREVLIRLPAQADPHVLTPFGLDIYSFRPTRGGLEVTAGAFDGQIDALREAGYPVERISTVP